MPDGSARCGHAQQGGDIEITYEQRIAYRRRVDTRYRNRMRGLRRVGDRELQRSQRPQPDALCSGQPLSFSGSRVEGRHLKDLSTACLIGPSYRLGQRLPEQVVPLGEKIDHRVPVVAQRIARAPQVLTDKLHGDSCSFLGP